MTKTKTHSSKTKYVIIGIVTVSAIFAILAVILCIPNINAGKLIRKFSDLINSDDAITAILITDLSSKDEILGLDGREATIKNEEEINNTVERLNALLNCVEFYKIDGNIYSGWDIRMRLYFAEGDNAEIYLQEESVYFKSGGAIYFYKPVGESAAESLKKLCDDLAAHFSFVE